MEVKYNSNKRLLESHTYDPALQDVAEPELYRKIFEYGSIPKITFNMRTVPMNMPKNIWITDTTFRDGQQGNEPYSVKDIVEIFKLISKLGGPHGIIRQSEFFLYRQKDREAVDKCRELGLKFPEITSWIRASEKDFELVKSLGLKETGILTSCSDYHIFKKMNLTRKKALDKYLDIVKMALDRGIVPRCHFEDITRADYYGFVVPFAIELMKLSEESGIPIKIRACDTMGYGITFPGAAMPRAVQGIIYGLVHYAEFPSEQLEWHGHNDFYKVVTNASTAWLYGCSAVNTSVLGIGERTGNCPLEAMAIEYAAIRGTADGMDLSAITELAEYFENVMGYQIPPRTPFVGKNFNVTRAGIHADGMLKDEEIYNIFDTEKILKRPPLVAVDNMSGAAGIAFWINNYFELKGDKKVEKQHSVIAQIRENIDKQFADGRVSCMGDAELSALIKQYDSELYDRITKA